MIASGDHLIDTHLNSLDHTISQADLNKHLELFQNKAIPAAAQMHKLQFISEHGPRIWDGISDMSVREFLAMKRRDGNAGEFYDLIKSLKGSNEDLYANSTSVDDFMNQVYGKDELIRVYKETILNQTTNPVIV